MGIKAEATIEDLYKVEGKAELVNGKIVKLPYQGGLPHFATMEIRVSLHVYGKTTRSGCALGGTVAFVVDLPHRKSFSPDAAFYVGPDTGMKFPEGRACVRGRSS